MKWADKIGMKLSTPVTAERLKQLLDDRRLVVVAGKGKPLGVPRVVVLDEVDSYPRAKHQDPVLTTRS